jgi:hypothetical protein
VELWVSGPALVQGCPPAAEAAFAQQLGAQSTTCQHLYQHSGHLLCSAGVAAASPEFATPSRPEEPHAQGSLTCIAFSPAGDFLAASDDTGRVYVWAIPPDMLAAQQVSGPG